MVRHPALRKIVGTNLFRAVSGANLASSKLRLRIVGFLLLDIIELCPKQRKGFRLVLKLRFFRLAVYHYSRGIMGKTHRRIRGVYALASVSRRAHYVDSDILFINDHIHFLHFRHYGHGDGRCVNTSARLCLRHTLYPVHAAFVFQSGIRSLTAYHKVYFLHAADSDFVHVHGFHLPSLAFRVVYIKAVYFRRKKSRLVASRARPDFHDNILVVIGVLWQKENLKLLLKLLNTLFGGV